jgi:cytochrome c oxidase subunit 4
MSESHDHGISVLTYLGVFAALLVLTALTVWVAFQDFGQLNNVIALGIAVIKSTMVVLFFMHVLHSTPLTKIVLVTSVFFFLILVAFVYADVWTRALLNLPERPPMIP